MLRRVLVVEDERKLAELIKVSLEAKGFVVLLAHDGEKGLEVARRERPALVLSDVLLPKLNGWDLCRKVRSESTLASTRVVLMTAVYTKARYRVDATEAGADDFVPKPLDLDDLALRIERLLGAHSEPERTRKEDSWAETPPAEPEPARERSSEVGPPVREEAPPSPAPAVASSEGPQVGSSQVGPAGATPQPVILPRRKSTPVDVEAALAGLVPAPRPAARPPSAKPAAAEPEPENGLAERLAAMRRRFARGLPATMAEIETAWVRSAGGCELPPWEDLARLAHDLAGSAGSFGLPAVGDAARELEEAIRVHLAGGVPLGGKARANIKQHVERLGALVHLL